MKKPEDFNIYMTGENTNIIWLLCVPLFYVYTEMMLTGKQNCFLRALVKFGLGMMCGGGGDEGRVESGVGSRASCQGVLWASSEGV